MRSKTIALPLSRERSTVTTSSIAIKLHGPARSAKALPNTGYSASRICARECALAGSRARRGEALIRAHEESLQYRTCSANGWVSVGEACSSLDATSQHTLLAADFPGKWQFSGGVRGEELRVRRGRA